MVRDCLQARAEGFIYRPRTVFDANGHGVSLRATDPGFASALENADVVHADGGFLVPASRWLAGKPISERSATTDLIHDFVPAAIEHNLSYYLLGGTEDVNSACARELHRRYPDLKIVGRHHGFFDPGESSERVVVEEINAAKPDIVWVGLGKPREQQFGIRWAGAIRAGWLVSCGGCFNYIVGEYGRAPLWMQNSGLEWVYRMATSPRQLLWRYLSTTPHALWLTVMKTPRGQG
jgi:N-acetylglucosaminyldiphosphoundecaprenol N-acetyl-beta-D-mannosaminyltransferase